VVLGRGRRSAVLGLLATVALGCGIVELEADEDPDGLDPIEEPAPADEPAADDEEPPHPADEDVDNAEGTD
jgi:hypothetical protein